MKGKSIKRYPRKTMFPLIMLPIACKTIGFSAKRYPKIMFGNRSTSILLPGACKTIAFMIKSVARKPTHSAAARKDTQNDRPLIPPKSCWAACVCTLCVVFVRAGSRKVHLSGFSKRQQIYSYSCILCERAHVKSTSGTSLNINLFIVRVVFCASGLT